MVLCSIARARLPYVEVRSRPASLGSLGTEDTRVIQQVVLPPTEVLGYLRRYRRIQALAPTTITTLRTDYSRLLFAISVLVP
jgi:hypothetical protein